MEQPIRWPSKLRGIRKFKLTTDCVESAVLSRMPKLIFLLNAVQGYTCDLSPTILFKVVHSVSHRSERGCSCWIKKPAFPNHFLFIKSKRANFFMIVYHYIRQLVVQDFFQKGLILLHGKQQKLDFFSFLPCCQNT